MVLSDILSFTGGIIATITGVGLKNRVDQARKKINEVYAPIYNEISNVEDHDLSIKNGRITSIWQNMEGEKEFRISSDIVDLIGDYSQHLKELNQLLNETEKAIVEDIQNEDGILPKSITTYNDDGKSNDAIVYSRKANGSIKSNGGVGGFMNIVGSDLIYAKDADDLEQRLCNIYPPKYRRRFEKWDQDCFEGLIQLVSNAEKKSIDREMKIESLDDIVESLLKKLEKRMSVWRLMIHLD